MTGLNFNAIRMFKIMHQRARDGQAGLSVSAYSNALDIEDRAIVLNCLDRLEKVGLIRVDIGGERPAVMILKGHHKAKEPLERPLPLPMARHGTESTKGISPAKECAATPVLYTEIIKDIGAPALSPLPEPVEDGVKDKICLTLSDAAWDYLFYELDRTDQCTSAVMLCGLIAKAPSTQGAYPAGSRAVGVRQGAVPCGGRPPRATDDRSPEAPGLRGSGGDLPPRAVAGV